jgi:hypothetical protein
MGLLRLRLKAEASRIRSAARRDPQSALPLRRHAGPNVLDRAIPETASPVPCAASRRGCVGRDGSFVDGRDRLRALRLPVYSEPYGLLVRDIDADGRIEVVVANRDSNDVWGLHRRATPVNLFFDCMPLIFETSGPTRP